MIIFESSTIYGILPAFNNNIIKFKSNSTSEGVQARVLIGGYSTIIYKLPSGWFMFNFKEVAKLLVNQNNFIDNLYTNINSNNINSYTYASEDGFYFGTGVLEVTLQNGNIETINLPANFIASVLQQQNYKFNIIQNENLFCLLPFVKNTKNKYYVKYFEGYPFDISILDLTNNDIQILNAGSTTLFERKANITRLFFSDGLTDLINNSLINISTGENELVLINQNDTLKNKIIILDYVPLCGNDGIYLKWFNAEGGYSYYLFNKFYQKDLSQNNIGELNNDFYNLIDTISPTIQIGKNVQDKYQVETDLLNENEFNLLVGVLASPKVFMFTGKPMSISNHNDWLEVEVKSSSVNIRDWKNKPRKIGFTFELPKRNYQSI